MWQRARGLPESRSPRAAHIIAAMGRWLFAAITLFACTNESDRELSEVCDNVGFAIASRTLACAGDPELANARYERFASSTRCAVTSPNDVSFDCVRAVNAKRCDEVSALGDDFAAWIATSSTCPSIFGGAP